MATVFAGIVLYNPDVKLLRENIAAVKGQVDELWFVDNASTPTAGFAQAVAGQHVISNTTNLGVAAALNQIIGKAADLGHEWVLLLDQDSACEAEAVARLAAHMQDDVGIICPRITDRNLAGEHQDSLVRDVGACITSGAMYRVASWRTVGGYDESLFIDYVDFDYCIRVRQAGFRIIRDPGVRLLHQIGNASERGPGTAWGHSPQRLEHMASDMLRYARKHRRTPREYVAVQRSVRRTYMILAFKAYMIVRYEPQKRAKVGALMRGVALSSVH